MPDANRGASRNDGASLYPLFLDLRAKRVLVAGAGSVAHRRVLTLLEAGAAVTVVAPKASPEVKALAAAGRVELLTRAFKASDADGRDLVLSATGDREVDEAVAAAARARGVFVNVADDIGLSDFHIPAIERRGDLQIAVSSGGRAPGLAALLRDRFASSLGPEWERFARLLGEVRELARTAIADGRVRMELMRRLANDDALLAEVARGSAPSAEEVLRRATAAEGAGGAKAPPRAQAPGGAFVSIVGAGPGSPGLITVDGLRRLQEADVVIYDDLVDRRLLAEAPRAAELIYHGKRGWKDTAGGRSPVLPATKALVGEGRHVVRLKGGDPSVFGRLDEEIAELRRAGVPFEILPGVTAAAAAAAAAAVPLTKRGVVSHLTLMAGVGAGDTPSADAGLAAELLERGGSVALYMGLRRLKEFVSALLAAGVSPEMPAVVVAAASTPEQHIVHATIADIVERVAEEGLGSPALTMFGKALERRD